MAGIFASLQRPFTEGFVMDDSNNVDLGKIFLSLDNENVFIYRHGLLFPYGWTVLDVHLG